MAVADRVGAAGHGDEDSSGCRVDLRGVRCLDCVSVLCGVGENILIISSSPTGSISVVRLVVASMSSVKTIT